MRSIVTFGDCTNGDFEPAAKQLPVESHIGPMLRLERSELARVFDKRGLDQCGQATKGVWGMSWHQEAMKGVEICDKPGGADKQVLIPGFPN
jgi:hypothetical protein